MKTCSSCQRSLPLSRFTKDSSRTDGLSGTCAWCKALRAARRRASAQGVPYELTLDSLPYPYPERCPVFGWLRLEVGSENRDNSPALDRIVPAKGYVPGNVRWISNRANELRKNATARELIALGRDGAWLASMEEGE